MPSLAPLFSNEALSAAQVAEQERIVMLAPLATDDAVSRNRQYVFQANPTIATRGRLMARFAVLGLGINEIGVIADLNNNESLRMAQAFAREVQSLEANIVFNEGIADARTWFRMSEGISRDTLRKADAIYLPINGGNASTLIGGALTSLDRMGFGSRLRLLGNVEWHNISQMSLAGNYRTTYSNDFYPNPSDSLTTAFQNRYLIELGTEPTRLSYSGYDVTEYIAQQLHKAWNESRPLDFAIRQAPMFEGYANRLDFSKGNVNEAMFYHRYEGGTVQLIR